MRFSSIPTFFLLVSTAVAEDFILAWNRPGPGERLFGVSMQEDKLAAYSPRYRQPVNLRLDGDVLVNADTGVGFSLNRFSQFEHNYNRESTRGFTLQDEHLRFNGRYLYACPRGDTYWLTAECDPCLAVRVRIYHPRQYSNLKLLHDID